MFYGTLFIYPTNNRKTLKCLLLTKFRFQIVTKNQPVKIVTITSLKTKCDIFTLINSKRIVIFILKNTKS